MKKLLVIACIGIISILVYNFNASEKRDVTDPYIEILDDIDWYFREGHADLDHYVDLYHGKYQLEISKEDSVFISFLEGDKKIYSFEGHPHTPFLVINNILYYANYSPASSGCEIVAYDFNAKAIKWRRKLVALGAQTYSGYDNKVSMTTWGKNLFIFGDESHGKYMEVLNLEKGFTIHNRIISEDFIKLIQEKY